MQNGSVSQSSFRMNPAEVAALNGLTAIMPVLPQSSVLAAELAVRFQVLEGETGGGSAFSGRCVALLEAVAERPQFEGDSSSAVRAELLRVEKSVGDICQHAKSHGERELVQLLVRTIYKSQIEFLEKMRSPMPRFECLETEVGSDALLLFHRQYLECDPYRGALCLLPVETPERLILLYKAAIAWRYMPLPGEVLALSNTLPEQLFPLRKASGSFEPLRDRPAVPVYFGGSLFDNCDLAGNKLFARSLAVVSDGSVRMLLPQDYEQSEIRAEAIKKQDLWHLLTAGMAIFNFNGSPVDDGTIVEYEAAQRLGLPIVIVRTDIRAAGDGVPDGKNELIPFNLMMVHGARTTVVTVNGLARYQACRSRGAPNNDLVAYHNELAQPVLSALEEARLVPSRFNGDMERVASVYHDFIEEKALEPYLLRNGGENFLSALLRFKQVSGLL